MSVDDDELIRRIHAESAGRRQGYPKCDRCVLPHPHSQPHYWHGKKCSMCDCPTSWTDPDEEDVA